MSVLILGLVLFLGVHTIRIVAPEWRGAMVARLGEGPWKGIYALVSLVGFVLIVWGYALARPAAPILYEPPEWLKHVNLALMWFSFVFLVSAEVPAGRIKAAVRHPMLLAVKVWAFGHILANGDLVSLLLFGTFLIWAVADRISLKRRGDTGPAQGPAKWDVIAIVIATLLYVLFMWKLHWWLFGVQPLP